MSFTIAKKRDAVDLLALLADSRNASRLQDGVAVGYPAVPPVERITHGFMFLTPTGGIPARSGSTPGIVECELWFPNEVSHELEPLVDDEGNSQFHEVWNIFSSPVAGDVFITAKLMYTTLVADAEDCPA